MLTCVDFMKPAILARSLRICSDPAAHWRFRLGRRRPHRAEGHGRAVARALLVLRRYGSPALWHQVGGNRRALCNRSYSFSRSSEYRSCLLYTSDAADEEDSVDLGGSRI